MKYGKLKKIRNRIITIVAVAALMIVNIQVGLTDGENVNSSLKSLGFSIFTPAVVATVGGGSHCSWNPTNHYCIYYERYNEGLCHQGTSTPCQTDW